MKILLACTPFLLGTLVQTEQAPFSSQSTYSDIPGVLNTVPFIQVEEEVEIVSKEISKMPEPTQRQRKNLYCPNKVLNNRNQYKKRDRTQRDYLAETLYGFDMYVDSLDGSVSMYIATSGTWQPEIIKLIGHIVKPGDNILNIGSQTGLEAIIMGKLSQTGQLHIFQPYSVSNSLLTKNIQLNGLTDRTTIYNFGASDRQGTAVISVQYDNTGGSQILSEAEVEKRKKYFSETEKVQLKRADDVLPKNISFDFALVDVETMEIAVLNGLRGVIERSPKLVLMVEWATKRKKQREEALDLVMFMQARGYKAFFYRVSPSSECKIGRFDEVKPSAYFNQGLTDIYFFPPDVPLPTND